MTDDRRCYTTGKGRSRVVHYVTLTREQRRFAVKTLVAWMKRDPQATDVRWAREVRYSFGVDSKDYAMEIVKEARGQGQLPLLK